MKIVWVIIIVQLAVDSKRRRKEYNKFDVTADWRIIIGPGGLLLVVLHYLLSVFHGWDSKKVNKQGVTNTLALPINKMSYIYLLCPHSEHQKKHLFQFEQSKHFHQRHRFITCETSFNKVKLPKVRSNVIVLGLIHLDVKNIFDYFDPLFMSNLNYECSYLMVEIMLMVRTVIFFCDASSKLSCEITKH